MPAEVKVNFFSPLPPVRSEIGNHTLTVVEALREHAEITLWTPQTEAPVSTGEVPVVRYDPASLPWHQLNRADVNVYNIGNNATFHRGIFDVARQAPGVVVLHDTRLQHFFARYSETEGADREFYLECMRRSHGLQGVDEAKRFLARKQGIAALVDRFPMTAAALEGALAAVVHNAAEAAALAAQTRTPVFHLPLAFAAGPPPERPARVGQGWVLRLIVFGFMGLNRRLESILNAVAATPDPDVRLDIYGSLEDPAPVEEQVGRLGLSERVAIHGFVPAAALTEALAAADLAINLRYPSMGEASASQLRIWDGAVPSLVTRTGWYATLPADAVGFVEPEREVASIVEHLSALRADPEPFRRAGLRGRELLLERHTPGRYAEGLLQIAGLTGLLHARCEAISLSRVAAQALMGMVELDAIAGCADPVAEAIHALTSVR